MKLKKGLFHPLVIVIAAISIIEVAMTVLYPQLNSAWEKIPVLIVILLIPLSIVSAFIYLWIKRPGFLYPPSEYGSDEYSLHKMALMDMTTHFYEKYKSLIKEKELNSIKHSEDKEGSG